MATVARRCSSSLRRLVLGLIVTSAAATVNLDSLPLSGPKQDDKGHVQAGGVTGQERWCTVGELLPQPADAALSAEWSSENVVDLPYGCDCASIKSRWGGLAKSQ